MAKEFGRARCPIVSNALTLEAYISVGAHMYRSGYRYYLLLLIYIGRSVGSNHRYRNRMTCYCRCAIGLLVKGNVLNRNISLFSQHMSYFFFFFLHTLSMSKPGDGTLQSSFVSAYCESACRVSCYLAVYP